MNKLSYLLGYMEKRAVRAQYLMEALQRIEKANPKAMLSIERPLTDMIPEMDSALLGYMKAGDLRDTLETLAKERGTVTAALSPKLKHSTPDAEHMSRALGRLTEDARLTEKGIKRSKARDLAMDKTLTNLFG